MGYFNGQRNRMIFIIVLVVVLLSIIIWQGVKVKNMHFAESILYQMLRPFQKIVTNINHAISDYWTLLTNLKEIRDENKQLKKTVNELQLLLTDYDKIKLENQRLRKLLAFKELVPYKMVGAQVIGVTPNNWVQNLIIDGGTKDGIEARMPVITYYGALVGQIAEASISSSRVILLNDPDFVVSARIQREDSRAIGVIRALPDKRDIVLLDQIPWDVEVREGDLVVTSGLSTVFPSEIPIGKVIRVKEENFGLIQQAEVKPFMILTPVEEVLVITDF